MENNEYLLTVLVRRQRMKSFFLLCPHLEEYTEKEEIIYPCKGEFTDKLKKQLEKKCENVDNNGTFNYQKIISARIIKIEKI